MQDTGFTLAQYAINNVGWTNLNNILNPDGSYAASTPVSGQSSEFTLGGFLFNIPTNSLISGFEIEVIGYRGITSLPGTTLEIWAYDNTNDANAYYQVLPVFSDFGTSVGTFVLGSSTYTFNQVIDWAQANNMKFKFVVNGEVYLDSVRVRVFYQESVNVIVPITDTCTTLIQAQPFYLQTPIGSNDTTCIVNKFQTSSGRPIFQIDIPNGYPATLDQGKSNEENIIITDVLVLSGDRRQLTISRGWSDTDPVGQDVLLRKPHGSGAELTLSNNIEFYDLFLRKCHIGSLVSAPITFRFNGSQIASYVRDINVTGSGATASAVSHVGSGGGQDITINVSGNNTVPPVVNGSSSGTSGNVLVNTLTYNTHAITGTNRATLVSVSMSSGVALSSVTLGGNAMTLIGANDSGGVRIEDWVLVNPPLGVQAVLITVAASATSYLASTQTTWNGATQTTPFTLATTNDGTDNDSEGNATTTVNNSIIVHTLATALPTITYSAGSGENIIVTSLTGQVQSGIQTLDVGTPSTQTSTINLSQNATWGNIILTLAPVAVIGDKFVAVTSADTTPGYLQDKVQAGANITLSVVNPGANEKLQITSSGGGGGGLTGVQNVGGGDGEIFRDITTGDTINLKTLESSDGSVTITNNADTIDLTIGSLPTSVGDTIIVYPKVDTATYQYIVDKTLAATDYMYEIGNQPSTGTAFPTSVSISRYERDNNTFVNKTAFATISLTTFTTFANPRIINSPIVYNGNIYLPIIDASASSGANNSFGFIVVDGTTGGVIGETNALIPTRSLSVGPAVYNGIGSDDQYYYEDNQNTSGNYITYTVDITGTLTISLNATSSTHAAPFGNITKIAQSVNALSSSTQYTNINTGAVTSLPVAMSKYLGQPISGVGSSGIILDGKVTQLLRTTTTPSSFSELTLIPNNTTINF